MKKLLLSLAAAVGVLCLIPFANATEQTVTWAEQYPDVATSETLDGTTKTVGEVSISFAKNSGSNPPAYYTNGTNLRIYANNTMTVSVPVGMNITSIVFTAANGYSTANFNASTGTLSDDTWSGSANSITFTVTSGQSRLTGMVVTYDGTSTGGGGTTDPEPDPDPDPDPTPGEGTVVETLVPANFSLTNSYAEHEYTSELTGITYNAFAYKGTNPESIQIRTTNNNSGIVVTNNPNGYKVKSIEIEQTSASQLDVYANTNAYANPADLFGNDNKGVNVGSISTTSGSIDFVDGQEYWGVRSSSGARYITSIKITYEGTGGGDTPVEPTPGGETVNVTYDSALQGYDNGATVTSWTGEGVTIDFSKGNGNNPPAYYNTGTAVRLYAQNTMTVSAPEGSLISKIELAYGTGDGTNAITTNVGNWSSPTWTGSANSVVFTVGGSSGHRRIYTVTVTYTTGEAPAVLTPQITCENNVVTMTCATEGAEIYYTTNGSEPSKASNKYSAPINISQTTNFKARAYVGEQASSVASYTATYIGVYQGFEAFIEAGANTEGTIAGPMTAIYQSGQYLYVIDNEDYPMLVYGNVGQTLSNGDEIANIQGKYSPYNGLPEVTNPVLGTITTGGTPVAPSTITADQIPNIVLNSYVEIKNLMFTGELTMEDSEGNVVTLYKRFTEVNIPTDQNKKYDVIGVTSIFNGTYQVYPISFEEVVSSVEQVATPVFDPEGGEVAMGSTVTITCATDGATIYYTVNGDTPSTASNLYSAPIAINEAQTIKAIAVKEGMDNSFIATATYTVFDPNAVSEMFDFSDPNSLNPTNGNTVEIPENGTGYTVAGFTFQEGDAYVIISEQVGNTPPRLWAATGASEGMIDLRLYTGEYFIVRVDGSQYHLTGIEFTKAGGNFDMTSNVGSLTKNGNNASWTPSSAQGASMRAESGFISDVQFDITGTTRISTIKVSYTDGAGDVTTEVIEIEAADESDAVYYNLQGVRVQNPERGIYVKVVNGKATKVLK